VTPKIGYPSGHASVTMFAGVIVKQAGSEYQANIAPGPVGHRHVGNTRDVI